MSEADDGVGTFQNSVVTAIAEYGSETTYNAFHGDNLVDIVTLGPGCDLPLAKKTHHFSIEPCPISCSDPKLV